MSYVDGYLLAVPKKNARAYERIARNAGKVWMKHGALQYFECAADQLSIPGLPLTISKLLKLKPSETAYYSFIIYKSRAHRDRVNKKVMNDPDIHKGPKKMPFDMKRMAAGGFKAVVEF